MSLSSKKTPCPICGGKIPWFLLLKIEGEYICGNCYSKIDMESDKADQLTMQGFREYLAFYDQNQLLRDQFVISARVDFGYWNTKVTFDYQNKLFCVSKNPYKTVFEGKQLKSFTIKEGSALLFEGSGMSIRRYACTVLERAMAIAPLEPFRAFHVELHFDHPYWPVIECEIDGPQFDNNRPDVSDYIRAYQSSIEQIEKLVAAFKTVAFPGATFESVGGEIFATAE